MKLGGNVDENMVSQREKWREDTLYMYINFSKVIYVYIYIYMDKQVPLFYNILF